MVKYKETGRRSGMMHKKDKGDTMMLMEVYAMLNEAS